MLLYIGVYESTVFPNKIQYHSSRVLGVRLKAQGRPREVLKQRAV